MFETLKMGFSEVQWVVTTVLIVFTWYLKRESASAKEVLDLRLRVVELENTIRDMPSKVDVAMLQGRLDAMNQHLEIVQRGVTRIENWLLENKK